MSNAEITVLLVDDHALVREAVAERLERETDITVVGTAGTADEAIRLAFESKPNIILMDIEMPDMSCFDAVRQITAAQPHTQVVFLSGYVYDSYIEEALAVRARGYLVKREALETVVIAVREVAAGGVFFSDAIQARIVVKSGSAGLASAEQTRASTLTFRETEILRHIARGLAKKQIGNIMNISVKTVDAHVVKVMNKLDIHDRVELSRFAIREGLVEA